MKTLTLTFMSLALVLAMTLPQAMVLNGCSDPMYRESIVVDAPDKSGFSGVLAPTAQTCTIVQAGPASGFTAKCYLACVWRAAPAAGGDSRIVSMMGSAPCDWKGQKLKVQTAEQQFSEEEIHD